MRAISFISALLVLPAAFASPIDFELESRASEFEQSDMPHGSADKY